MLVDLMDFDELVNIISLIDSINCMAFMDLMRFATQGEIFTHMKLYPYVSVSNLTHMHFSKPQALTNFKPVVFYVLAVFIQAVFSSFFFLVFAFILEDFSSS